MSHFSYRARNRSGDEVKGTLRAPTQDRARLLLTQNGLTPLAITLVAEQRWWTKTVFGGGPSTRDLILFSQQLSAMIRAGVPVLQSLQAIYHQLSKEAFKGVLQQMVYDIEGGDSLSLAMNKYPQVFSPFFLGVVRTGEASGRLSQSLASVGAHLEQDYEFIRKVRAALTYPALILGAIVVVVIIVFVLVLPQLVVLFQDANVPLPLPTRVLVAVTLFWQKYWYVVGIAAIVLGLLVRSYLKTPEGRYTVSSYTLRLPIVSNLVQKIYLTRLTSMLTTLFSSDVPVIDSLKLAQQAIGNRVYQRILTDTINAVKDGAPISAVWENEPYMPPLLTAMVSVGEKSGTIDKSLNEAHRFFKRDVETMLSSITVLLEPLMVILLGIGVAFVVASILLPIYNLVLVL